MMATRRNRIVRAASGPPRRLSVVGVIGELLITGGVLVFLFLGWQLWLNDLVVGAGQNTAGVALSHNLRGSAPVHAPATAPPTTKISFGDPVVAVAPGDAIQFAVMYVPRFGADYARPISQGVGTATVLN
ncbi:MAG: sortase, partial [Microbacteriaceae bacterium]|nr:sortase [Microbacteriaceae bacterium]